MERQFRDPHRMIVAVSQMCADDYQRYHDVPAARIRLVYHGTDTVRFSPEHRQIWRQPVRHGLGIADGDIVFLFVGHDFVRKGLATAMSAVQRLAAEGCPARLVVVGQRKSRRQQGCASDPHGVVQFTGRVTDTSPYYAAADALVLPTFYDPCSLTVGEALASGLPVVTTRVNGASEMLTEGRDGFILDDPTDAAALCERLRPLVDPGVRERMGSAARHTALRFPLERNCDEIIRAYEATIERRSQHKFGTRPGRPTAAPAAVAAERKWRAAA
jgi:UDP-glucose:(heptosyl)LPS alpha-1,3-glucosyltransferase